MPHNTRSDILSLDITQVYDAIRLLNCPFGTMKGIAPPLEATFFHNVTEGKQFVLILFFCFVLLSLLLFCFQFCVESIINEQTNCPQPQTKQDGKQA